MKTFYMIIHIAVIVILITMFLGLVIAAILGNASTLGEFCFIAVESLPLIELYVIYITIGVN